MRSLNTAYPSGDSLIRFSKRALVWIFGIGAVSASIWAIVFGIMNWERGIYAGFHLGDAEHVAYQAMVVNYGFRFANEVQFANPPAVKKHFNLLSTGTGQVREIHLIGPRGVHYCVDVWDPHRNWTVPDKHGFQINIGGSYRIQKNCSFS